MSQAPRVLRRDFVMNANDSYRYTNPDAPETAAAHSPLYGDDEGRPSPRTLMNLATLRAGRRRRRATTAASPSTRPPPRCCRIAAFTAERLRDEVLAACGRRPREAEEPTPCELLRAWDGRFSADSAGAALWRGPDGGARPRRRGAVEAAPSTARRRILTPDGLDRSLDEIKQALAEAGRPTTLGEVQHTRARHHPRPARRRRRARRGRQLVGRPTTSSGTPRCSPPHRRGYAVNYGSSFILAAELGPAGLEARALLTYGNSSDPASPHYRDQLEAFAAGALRPVRFTEADIAADPALVSEDISGP